LREILGYCGHAGFAVLGYLMKKFEYEPAPLVLAFVLGRMAEESVSQSLVLSGRLLIFFKTSHFVRAVLLAFILIASPLIGGGLKRFFVKPR